MARAVLIGTVETKRAALDHLAAALAAQGLEVEVIDLSLAAGRVLDGAQKLAAMAARGSAVAADLAARSDAFDVALGIGGGTGSEIVLAALRGLPARFPKLLVTTLAFDPRPALADSAITIVPTLCDIEGMNALLAQALDRAAAMAAALARLPAPAPRAGAAVAVSALGATGAAAAEIVRLLTAAGREAVVFHANGYGGAAMARFLAEGGAGGVIDLCTHELGRLRLAGAHVPMPDRFTAAPHLPRVVLPGALNILGLGALDTLTADQRARPHYRHSALFTHVQLTASEMADQAAALAAELNRLTGPCTVILPMGGFSHQDRPGGPVEAPALRVLAAEVLERDARAYAVTRLPHHIDDPAVARAAVAALLKGPP
jgi:uncharacterized protein (UPF0261 family)